jgi:predicted nucleic acid-binding protein
VLVVDASVIVDVLLSQTPRARQARRRIAASGDIHAPELLDLEVLHVIRRALRREELTEARASAAIEDLVQLDLKRYPHTPFLPRIWGLRANATAYDAAYLALAEALDAPLVTFDRRLSRTPGHHAQVEVLG